MSLYSYSSRTSNSYSSLSSITTVSSQLDEQKRYSTTDDEALKLDHFRIEKKISLRNPPPNQTTNCLLKATMTKNQIILSDSLSNQSTIIPGKHLSMKVVFKF